MVQNHLPHNHRQTIEQELEHMPSVENFPTVADIFKQLGDGSRICSFSPSQAVEISRSDR